MNSKDLIKLGVPLGEPMRHAITLISKLVLAGKKDRLESELTAVLRDPTSFTKDELRGELARALLKAPPPPRDKAVPYKQWGKDLEHEAIMQMERACLLPISVQGALMPDAHVGYGLPIGGGLAGRGAVIPYPGGREN